MILFVGDAPRANMKPGSRAFKGAKCESRLMEWIGFLLDLSPLELLVTNDRYRIINQSDPAFYSDLHEHYFHTKGPTIALGGVASLALGKALHFKLPHPSGRNRQINDKEFIMSRLIECKLWLARIND